MIERFLVANRSWQESDEACAARSEREDVFDVVFGEMPSTERVQELIEDLLQVKQRTAVRFLYAKFPSAFTADILAPALLNEDFELFMSLRETYPSEAHNVVENVMVEAAEGRDVEVIRFIIEVLGRADLSHSALVGICVRNDLQSLRAVRAITGPSSVNMSIIEAVIQQSGQTPFGFGFSTSTKQFSCIKYLITVCVNGTREDVIKFARNSNAHNLVSVLEAWRPNPGEFDALLHPLTMGPRTPSWAFYSMRTEEETPLFGWRSGPTTWPLMAINALNMDFLQVIHELKQKVGPEGLPHYEKYSFERARAAAIQVGRLDILQWLVKYADIPIEPTLLCEAIMYHQREIADWLATNCPDACQKFDATITFTAAWNVRYGFDEDMLTWIESHEIVRNYVDFGVMALYAVKLGDVDGVRRMYKSYPAAFMTREDLWSVTTIQQLGVRRYLRAIAYPHIRTSE